MIHFFAFFILFVWAVFLFEGLTPESKIIEKAGFIYVCVFALTELILYIAYQIRAETREENKW